MSLANKAGKAGALMLFRKTWGALVNLAVMAYLARTLNKEDFGLLAISDTLINFIRVFGISGIGEYVIYYNGENKKTVINAAFWLNFFITVFIVIIVLVVGPFWAESFNNPKILKLSWLLLISFFASSLSSIPISLFRKSLDFKPMVAIQSIFGTISQITSVLLAYWGFGVYSLAIPNAIIVPIMCGFFFWKSGFIPSFKQLSIQYWKNIFNYTKHVIGSTVLAKFTNEGDTLIIGKTLGMEALGIYNIAYKLAHILSSHLLPIITTISFPIFAKNQNDLIILKQYYLKMVQLISIVFIPAFGAMIIFAPQIISVMYGAKWMDTVLPFQILCCFAVFRTISGPAAGLYGALGKPHLGFIINLIQTPLFLLTVYWGSYYGIIWCSIFIMAFRNANSFFHFFLTNKLLKLPNITFIRTFAPILIVTGVSMLITGLLNNKYPQIFILLSILYYVILIILLRKFNRNYFNSSFILIQNIMPTNRLKWKTQQKD